MPITDVAAAIKKARLEIILDQPFFGSLLMHLKTIETKTTPYGGPNHTFYTDGDVLAYNPDFAAKLTPREIRTVIAHEVLHCSNSHIFRRGAREPQRWNQAADFATNEILENCNEHAKSLQRPEPFSFTGELAKGCLPQPQFKGLSAEEIYNKLPNMPPQSGGKGKGKGQPDPNGDAPNGFGACLDAPGDRTQKAHKEAEWKVKTVQAATAAKQQGQLPASLQRLIDEIVSPSVPWREQLRHFFNVRAREDYSWKRPNKRLLGQGIYMPSLDSIRMGKVVVAVDTSGSIGREILNAFQSEMQSIMDECRPESLVCIYCDAAVNGVREYGPGDLIDLESKGGGGTDFRPVFDHVDEHGIEPMVIIYLTDLMGSFRDTPPSCDVIWACTEKNGTAPYGEVIHVSV